MTHSALTLHNHNQSTLFAALIRGNRLPYMPRSLLVRDWNNPRNHHQHINGSISSLPHAYPPYNIMVNLHPNNVNIYQLARPNYNTLINVYPNHVNMRPLQPNQNIPVNVNLNHANMNRPTQANQNLVVNINPNHVNINTPFQPNHYQAQQVWRERPNN